LNIPKELIIEAKEKFGDLAIEIIVKDLDIQKWDTRSLRGLCPFHLEDSPSFLWNPKNQSFKCFGCQKVYGIIDHYIKFNKMQYYDAVAKLFEDTGVTYSFGERGVKKYRDYRYPNREFSEDRSQVEQYLGFRGISKETLDYADVQQDDKGNIVFHFYDSNDVLTLVKYRPSRKVSKAETKSWCQQGADTKQILFNMNRIDPTKPLCILEGEIDSLSVIEAGFSNAISVPLGAGNFQFIEENWEWLEQFDSVICWSDSDDPGIKMRKEVCSRLGNWRCKYVDIPTDLVNKKGEPVVCKDANEVLFYCGKDKVLELIANAQELPIVGVTDLSTVDDFDIELAPGLFTSLDSVDGIIYKFLLGSVVLVTGTRGAGKSTLLNQFFVCESLNQGLDCFIFSGELSPSVLKSWIELTMSGRDKIQMKDKFVHIIDTEAKKKMREWYKERIWIYDQLSNEADDILDRAVNIIRKYGVKTIILDNLMVIGLKSNDNNLYEKQKEFMNKLLRLASLYNVLIILVTHPKKLQSGYELGADDISGSNSMSNLAQYIVSVKRYTDKEKAGEKDGRGNYKRGKEPIPYDVGLDILKNRFTGKVGRADLYFDYFSYRFYSTPKELYKRFKWNQDQSLLPTKDPNQHTQEPEWAKD
jgi:archaellum biogenesis ATPase FlaH/5S rRNA maturation endonuclease (ribonuclease M5)